MWADSYSGTFTKCTGTLTSGTYVIGDVDNTTIHAINNTVGNSWIVYTDVTIGTTGIINPDESVVWNYDSSTGYLKSADEVHYIYWPTGGNKGGVGTAAYAHDITEQSTAGNYKVASHDDNTRWIKRNGTSGYRYYNSGTPTLCFYKLSVSYTITTTVNESTMGSAAVSGTTITATPYDGYRVKAGDAGYTVTDGTATVTNNGNNTFTVSPSSDCTVQINFEAIPTHTLSSAVSPVGAGTVTLGSATVAEGATTTAEATANAGYKFTGWTISGTGASLSDNEDNPTTVTMGTADATVTANFTAVTTYAISWSVNGTVVKTDNVEENTAIPFPTTITGIPDGYVLKGWVVEENKITGTQNTAPTYAPETNATAAATYYAVMAVETGSSNTATLTANWSSSSTTYGDHSYTDDKGFTWTGYNSQPTYSGTAYFAIASSQKNNHYTYIKSPQFSGKITGIKMTTYNGSSNSRSILIKSTASGTTGDLGSYAMPGGEKLTTEHDINLVENVEFNEFYVGTNDGTNGFSTISVTYGSTSISNYCTTVPTATVTIAAACNDGKGVYYGTYSNGSAFVVPAADDMTVSAVSVDGEGTLTVTNYDEGDIVAAGTGVMVSSTTSGDHTITLAAGGSDIDGNMLKGSGDAAISASDMETAAPNCKYYRLTMHGYVENVNPGVIGFWWGAAEGAAFGIAANKAYLAVPTETAAKMNGFTFGDGETTSINLNANDNLDCNAPRYNLSGQRVSDSYKGIVIVNGKKYINK